MSGFTKFKKYKRYANERFPLRVYGIYTASLYFVSYLFGNTLAATPDTDFTNMVPGFAVIFLFFIQLRIFDEHKDFESDCIEHPDRMLSKGEITLKELRTVMYAVIALEVAINLFLGVIQLALWGIIFLWSLLMLKEFFCPDFLKKKPTLYIFSHQMVIPMICLYALSGRIELYSLGRYSVVLMLVFMSACICLTMSMEHARKIRLVPIGKEMSAFTPGRSNRLAGFSVSMLLAVFGWAVLMITSISGNTGAVLNIAGAILFAFYVLKGAVLYRNPEPVKIKEFKSFSMIFVFGIFILSGINFYFV
ncbi:MAG: UbiA family prenyltransferase [Clostridia bacterium]|nr:UbiA family prenyltransferase [Clostridia bacterium]